MMATQKKATRKPNTAELLDDLNAYDLIIVSFSGGKDSLACLLDLLERGVDRERIELWHQDVDGEGEAFMDWPVTKSYCQAVGDALGIKVRFQWKDGGFKREMLRENSRTAGVHCTTDSGTQVLPASTQAKPATRRKFPQVAADLKVRWCSAYLKIDVASRAIRNDSRLDTATTLFISGERAEESPGRAKYPIIEKHRTNSKKRTVTHWRNVADWTEAEIWAIIERWNITPHPCYSLGFGRCSCMTCIFGNADQWATVRELAPERFNEIAAFEGEFETTIHRTKSVVEQADNGTAYKAVDSPWREVAMHGEFTEDMVHATDWQIPAGAFCECGGPV